MAQHFTILRAKQFMNIANKVRQGSVITRVTVQKRMSAVSQIPEGKIKQSLRGPDNGTG